MSLQKFELEGLVAATFTPFSQQGDINVAVIPEYAKFLLHRGIKSVFVNGTTGEGNNLTVSERKQLAEAWLTNNKHGLDKVVIHIGGANLKESQEMAEHAKNRGADAIGLVPPTFFKPSSIDLLVEYCRQVAEKAIDVPFYYYHIPSVTGVKFDMLEFQQKMGTSIASYRGIKYSDMNMTEASLLCNQSGGKYNIVFGVDQQLLAALVFGIRAAIGSTYNYLAPVYNHLLEAFHHGDINKAREQQLKTQRCLDIIFRYGTGVSIQKEVMNMCVGFELGPARLPLLPKLPETENSRLKQELTQLGFFDWIK